MPIFYKFSLSPFLLFTFLPSLVLVYAQNNPNCLNYTIGSGEMEIGMTVHPTDQYIDYISKDNYLNKNSKLFLPIGWDMADWKNFDNKKVEMTIDRDTYLSGQGSLKIQINKEAGRDFGSSYNLRSRMTIPAHDNDTYPYYPQPGDQLVTKFYLKTPQVNNINIRYIIHIEYHTSSPIDTNIQGSNLLSSSLNLTPTNDFIEHSFTTTIPSHIGYLRRINIMFRFSSGTSSTAESQLLAYLDKFEMYTYSSTTNQCKTFPYHLRQNSSLKFFEFYNISLYPNDTFNFIRAYKDNTKIHVGNLSFWNLNLKKLDPEFKYFKYYTPTTMRRYYRSATIADSASYTIFYKNNRDHDEFNKFIDDLWVTTNTNINAILSDQSTRKRLIHPNSRYSDHLKLYNSTTCAMPYDVPYTLCKINDKNPHALELITKTFSKANRLLFKKLNTDLSPDGIYIDNFTHGDGSKNYIYFKEVYSKIFPYYSLIANGGTSPNKGTDAYTPTSSQMKFVGGYLNESWLTDSTLSSTPFYQSTTSSNKEVKSIYHSFNKVLSNYKLNHILLVAFYPYQCTTTNATLTAITAAAYLVNNPNVYFAFVLGGPNRSADVRQCQTDLMYLPLGSPLNLATNINQITVASTSSGYLYSRLYENGRVFFNSSDVTLTFTLSTSTEINGKTFYIDPVTNLPYDFSTTSLNITIGPKQGLILYTPTSSQNIQEPQLDQNFYY